MNGFNSRLCVFIVFAAGLAACGPSPNSQQQAALPPPPASVAPPPVAQAAPPPPPVEAAPAPEPAPAPKPHKTTHHSSEAVAEAPAPQPVVQQPAPPPVCSDCGTIASIQNQRQTGKAGMVGTLGGAAAGGLIGNQFGHGSGKTWATVAGVVGGALAGREVEKQVNASTVYNVTVNMDDGSQRTVTTSALNGLAVGSKVRVNGDTLSPN